MDIRGKVAIVTGGSSGIGHATAIRLAQEGASVVVADVDDTGARTTVARIAAAGGAGIALHTDVTSAPDVRRMFEIATERFGGLDILCNNAGITTGQPGYPEAAIEQWQRVLDINLRAVILGTQLALSALRARGGGVIVNTASMAAFVGFPADPIYAATKAAVVLFTHSMGPFGAQGIRVNCVCPGIVDTPMLRRTVGDQRPAWLDSVPMLQPEDVADGIVQLITDDSQAGRALQIAPGLREFASLPALPAS